MFRKKAKSKMPPTAPEYRVRVMCGFGVFVLAVSAWAQEPLPSIEELKRYLSELGLNSLQIEHELNTLDQETNTIRRQRKAQALLKEFEEFAFRSSSRQLSLDLARLRNLLIEYPDLNSIALRLAFAQTEFTQNYSSLLYVWKLSLDPNFLTSQQQSIQSLIREVEMVERRIQIDWQDSQIARLKEPAYPFDQMLLRSALLRGWLHLTLAVALHSNAEEAEASALCIRRALGMDQAVAPAEWLKSKSSLNALEANGLLAMAFGYSLTKKDDDANLIFDRLATHEPPLSDEILAWRIKSLVIRQSPDVDGEAVKLLGLVRSESARKQLEWALIECADVMPSTGENDAATRLAQLGIAQVLQSADFHHLDLIPKRVKTLAANSDFVAGWLAAVEPFQRYTKYRDPKDLAAAHQKMAELGSKLDFSEFDPRFTAAFYALHAEILFAQQDYSECLAKARISNDLRAQKQLPVDEKCEWLAVASLLELAKKKSELQQEAIAALEQFGVRFPANRNTRNIEWERSQLILSRLSPTESLASLQNKLKKEGYNWQLGYLLVEEFFRYWTDIQTADSEHKQSAAFDLEQAVHQLIAHPQTPAVLRLRAAILQHRVSLGTPANTAALVRGELELKRLLVGVPEENQVVAEALALIVTSASLRRDSSVVAEAAENLLGVTTQPDLLEIGRVAIAQRIENELLIESTATPIRKELVESAVANYFALINGIADGQLRQRKNLQVAAVNLVKYLLELNRAGEAKPVVQQLLRVAKDDRVVLRAAAAVFSTVGDLKAALEAYRALASGVPIGSEDWLFAKLGVVRCLRLENRKAALEVHQQVLELTPNLADEWKLKFDLLFD